VHIAARLSCLKSFSKIGHVRTSNLQRWIHTLLDKLFMPEFANFAPSKCYKTYLFVTTTVSSLRVQVLTCMCNMLKHGLLLLLLGTLHWPHWLRQLTGRCLSMLTVAVQESL